MFWKTGRVSQAAETEAEADADADAGLEIGRAHRDQEKGTRREREASAMGWNENWTGDRETECQAGKRQVRSRRGRDTGIGEAKEKEADWRCRACW